MVDPFLTTAPAGVVFCDVVIELQVMCSDRVDPNDPLSAEEEPGSESTAALEIASGP